MISSNTNISLQLNISAIFQILSLLIPSQFIRFAIPSKKNESAKVPGIT